MNEADLPVIRAVWKGLKRSSIHLIRAGYEVASSAVVFVEEVAAALRPAEEEAEARHVPVEDDEGDD